MTEIKRLAFRTLRALDAVSLPRSIRFADLRDRFFGRMWADAARQIGAVCQDQGDGFLRIDQGELTTFVRRSEVMLDSHLTLELAGNKAISYALLGECGCAVPRHARFPVTNITAARTFLSETDGPVVVKPARGTGGGRGVTTGITTSTALRRACWRAARYDTDLMIEQQVAGDSFRLLFIGGQFVDAIRRDPPAVTGDGRATIRELVARENATRLAANPFSALSPLELDRDARTRLAEQELTSRSRPGTGVTVALKRVVNQNNRDGNHRVTGYVHPTTIAAGERMVAALGIELGGLDVMCRDITAPLTSENGVFGEINTTPGLHHHELVSDTSPANPVSERLLRYMFDRRRGVMPIGAAASSVAPRPVQPERAA